MKLVIHFSKVLCTEIQKTKVVDTNFMPLFCYNNDDVLYKLQRQKFNFNKHFFIKKIVFC